MTAHTLVVSADRESLRTLWAWRRGGSYVLRSLLTLTWIPAQVRDTDGPWLAARVPEGLVERVADDVPQGAGVEWRWVDAKHVDHASDHEALPLADFLAVIPWAAPPESPPSSALLAFSDDEDARVFAAQLVRVADTATLHGTALGRAAAPWAHFEASESATWIRSIGMPLYLVRHALDAPPGLRRRVYVRATANAWVAWGHEAALLRDLDLAETSERAEQLVLAWGERPVRLADAAFVPLIERLDVKHEARRVTPKAMLPRADAARIPVALAPVACGTPAQPTRWLVRESALRRRRAWLMELPESVARNLEVAALRENTAAETESDLLLVIRERLTGRSAEALAGLGTALAAVPGTSVYAPTSHALAPRTAPNVIARLVRDAVADPVDGHWEHLLVPPDGAAPARESAERIREPVASADPLWSVLAVPVSTFRPFAELTPLLFRDDADIMRKRVAESVYRAPMS